MKGFYLLLRMPLKSLLVYLLLILQVFMALNGFVDKVAPFLHGNALKGVITQEEKRHIIHFSPSARFVPSFLYTASRGGDGVFENIYDELRKRDGVTDLGFLRMAEYITDEDVGAVRRYQQTVERGDYSKTPPAVNKSILMYNKAMIEHITLPLSEGEWFESGEPVGGVIPAVLSYDQRALYDVGDEVPIHVLFGSIVESFIHQEEYRAHRVKVIGFLNAYDHAVSLENFSEGGHIDQLFRYASTDSRTKNFMITPYILEEDGIVTRSIHYPPTLLFTDGQKPPEDYTKAYEESFGEANIGRFTSVDQMIENYQYMVFFAAADIYENILMLLIVVTGILGLTILNAFNMKRAFGLYYLSGMRWKKGTRLMITRNTICCIIAFVAALITSFFTDEFTITTVWQYPQGIILGSYASIGAGLLLLLLAGGLIAHFGMKAAKPLELIRRSE
ncbi:MAG: hypothetical protein ACOYJC_08330 [Christensenellales bacterium]|jgi:hypothetical protein